MRTLAVCMCVYERLRVFFMLACTTHTLTHMCVRVLRTFLSFMTRIPSGMHAAVLSVAVVTVVVATLAHLSRSVSIAASRRHRHHTRTHAGTHSHTNTHHIISAQPACTLTYSYTSTLNGHISLVKHSFFYSVYGLLQLFLFCFFARTYAHTHTRTANRPPETTADRIHRTRSLAYPKCIRHQSQYK